MDALVWEAPGTMNMRQWSDPQPAAGEVLIDVAYAGICGSDLGGYLGHNALRVPPLVMGHEFSGVVVALGEGVGRQIEIGQKVTCNPMLACGECRFCRSDMAHLCTSRKLIGAHRPGAFAERVAAPQEAVYALPDSINLRAAAIVEPVAVAMRISRLAGDVSGETVLVIGAEKLSGIVDWTDRNTCVLFGDGAGAAILRNRSGSHGVITTYMGADGNYTDILSIPGGGCRNPITAANVDQRLNTIKMAGKEVYKQAVNAMLTAAQTALEQSGLTPDDLACIIPHQANIRIIEAIAERMNVPLERFLINLDRYGNTSAAAVAIALDEANRTGRMKVGDYVLLIVFGGGLPWASSVIQW